MSNKWKMQSLIRYSALLVEMGGIEPPSETYSLGIEA